MVIHDETTGRLCDRDWVVAERTVAEKAAGEVPAVRAAALAALPARRTVSLGVS